MGAFMYLIAGGVAIETVTPHPWQKVGLCPFLVRL